ncbi:MAG: anaerobic ribonucleoside-triphosphate reductase activating protein [Clostridia bacterium]
MNIQDFNKLTLLDYPNFTASVVFTKGCNFRCPFCHNASLVIPVLHQNHINNTEFIDTSILPSLNDLKESSLNNLQESSLNDLQEASLNDLKEYSLNNVNSNNLQNNLENQNINLLEKNYYNNFNSNKENEFFDYINLRKNLLDGVCITGGEPTLNADLPVFIKRIKDMGLKVKLDTNGSNPKMLQFLIENNLIDYVAMDIKNSLDKYSFTAGVIVDTSNIVESAHLIMTKLDNYEFRTTLVNGHHTESDFHSIGKWLKNAKLYFLQSFKDSANIINNSTSGISIDIAEKFKTILQQYIISVNLRGYEI